MKFLFSSIVFSLYPAHTLLEILYRGLNLNRSLYVFLRNIACASWSACGMNFSLKFIHDWFAKFDEPLLLFRLLGSGGGGWTLISMVARVQIKFWQNSYVEKMDKCTRSIHGITHMCSILNYILYIIITFNDHGICHIITYMVSEIDITIVH